MAKKESKNEKPVTVHITNHNQFQKGVGAFITNLNHLTIVMDSEGNMKMDARQLGAMPHTQAEIEQADEEEETDDPPTDGDMAAACAKTKDEGLWWGNASWSVVFRIYCILGYKGNEESFIEAVKDWPFKQPFKYVCNRHALDRPLRRGRINGPIEKWAVEGASKREVKLGERLMALLRPETKDRKAKVPQRLPQSAE